MDALGAMTAGIAHEPNNLIMIIRGNVEIVGAEPLSVRQAERLERANRAACAASRLTHQILSFSAPGSLEAEIVDLNGLIGEFDGVLTQVVTPDLSLNFDLAAEPLLAKVNVGQVELALINLVRNASDASTRATASVSYTKLGSGPFREPSD